MSVVDRDLAVDDHIPHPDRQLPWMFISGPVRDGLFIKHNHVSVIAPSQQPTFGNAQRRRRQRTTRADREWRSNQLLYIDVFPELSRESAILARVSGRAIGPCHHKVLPHEILNVALGYIKGCKAG